MRGLIAGVLAASLSWQAGAADNLSGLPWNSGTGCYDEGFEAWRGRDVDVIVGWLGRAEAFGKPWPQMVEHVENKNYGMMGWHPAIVSIGVPLLTEDTRGQFARCAAGEFDGYVRRIGAALQSKFKRPIVIRLAWEANGTKSYPWYAGDDPEGFKACFRRQVAIYRETMPGSLIEFAQNKGKFDVTRMIYPGSEHVDGFGTHAYSRYPDVRTEADWQQLRGMLDERLEFAKQEGKWLALAEWGVSNGKEGGTDNPFFMEKMHGWFAANADWIGYEAYFDCGEANKYSISKPGSNPKAAAAYRALWGGRNAIAAAVR